jgi:hypothetical protein
MADLKLSFLNNKLDQEQIKNAEKVAKAAIAMGVDPALAVSIDFAETDLRSGAPNLKTIKEALAYTENNPKLAALYYHSGATAIADLAADKPIAPKAKQFLLDLKGFGTFEAFNPNVQPPAEAEEAPRYSPQEPPPDVSEPSSLGNAKELTPEQDFIRENSLADLRRKQYGLVGAGTGTALALAPYAGRTAAGFAGNLAKAFNEAKQPIPKPPTAPMGGLPTGGAPTPPQMGAGAPTGGLPTPQGQPPTTGRQAPGYMTRNYGTAAGLTEIEAGRALDNTKQAGGVHDLLSQRREAMNKIQGMGGSNFVENPRFGGIMTQAPSVGGGPRESFAMQTPEAGKPAQLAPIPKAPIIPTTPPPPSGLDQVKNLFTGMMRQGMRLLPVVGPPLAGYSIGRDLADIESQYERAPVDRDYTDMGLSAAGILATGASLYPPAFPVAAPLSIGIPTIRNFRRDVLARESDPEIQRRNMMPPTEEELAAANRPYIGYPRQTGKIPFQPRLPPLGTVPPSEIIGN